MIQQTQCTICGSQFQYIPIAEYIPRNCMECLQSIEDKTQISERMTKAKRERERKWNEICPHDCPYAQTDISLLPCRKQTETALAWQPGRKGLVLFGPTRRGKTRTLYLLLKQHYLRGSSVRVFGPAEWGGCLADRQHKFTAEAWCADLLRYDIVAFDDFGKQKLSPKAEGEWFGVFEARIKAKKPTLFTMNHNGNDLTKELKYGKEIVARMREFCTTIYFP